MIIRQRVIQSDHVAHELMAPGARSYDAIVQAFGNGILNEDQTINRPSAWRDRVS